MGDQSPTAENVIEIQIEEIAQLFHTLDPFPFREKDLSKDAEEFIVSWAIELPTDQPIRIVVHLPQAQFFKPEAGDLGTALTKYFAYRVRVTALELNELFRVGRRALGIGLGVLSFCVVAGQTAAASLTPRPIGRVIQESLMIFWVGRELEADGNFLYDWWPIVRRHNLYRRLSAADVELRPYKKDQGRQGVPELSRLRADH
jgi:hypothetical protein